MSSSDAMRGNLPAGRGALLSGVYHGVVSQNKDPDGRGRIKVRLPWLDGGDADQAQWAQMSVPMAGDKFGWYALPDVDDAVAVVFIDGDIQHPVVIGGIWSKTDAPPELNGDGKNNFRGYRSRSGHRLILDDSSQVKVVFADKTNQHMVGIGSFSSDGDGDNKCAVYKPASTGEGGIAISSMDGKVTLACPNGKLKVTANQNITISATMTVAIKAGTELKITGSLAKASSTAPAQIDGMPISIGS